MPNEALKRDAAKRRRAPYLCVRLRLDEAPKPNPGLQSRQQPKEGTMKSILLAAALVLLIAAPPTEAQQPQAPTSESSRSTQEKSLKRGVAWLDDKGDLQITYVRGTKGVVLGLESLVFDSGKKLAGAPGGIILETKESPVATVIYSMGSTGTGSAGGKYSNIEINVSELQGKRTDIRLIHQVTPDSTYLCTVALMVAGHATITISDTYQVFADGKREMQKGGPYVRLRFDPGKTGLGTGTVILMRNGAQLAKTSVAVAQKDGVLLGKVKETNDVLEWRITDTQGKLFKKGALGFPIAGVSPELVHYVVELDKVP